VEVTAFFYSELRELLGRTEMTVTLSEGSCLQEMIDKLVAELGDKAKSLYPDPDSPFPIMIAVGTKDHRFCGGMSAKLEDGMVVYFIPPAVGG